LFFILIIKHRTGNICCKAKLKNLQLKILYKLFKERSLTKQNNHENLL